MAFGLASSRSALVRPPGGEEEEGEPDPCEQARFDPLEEPEAACGLVDGGHVHVRPARVWLHADARV